jgi:D-alanyl-D-alanine carboxypeptidase
MMANTGVEDAKGSSLSPVTGYRFHEGTFSTAPPVNVHATFAAGDLVSTAEDLDRWLRAVSSGKLLSAQTWQKALAQTSLKDGTRADYGHGWVVRKLLGQPLYEHTGVISGFQAMIMLLPESQLSVVFVSNRQTRHNNARKLGEQIAAIAIGKPLHQPVAIKLEETKLRLFEGTYQHGQSDRRSIRAEGAGLVLQFERQRVRLTPSGEDEFFVADGSHTRYRFVRDANGTVTQLIRIDVGDEEKRYARVELPSR